LRAAIYGGVADAIANNDVNIDNLGRLIVLPSSFIGGHQHMAQLYQDSMAIVRQYGKPNIALAWLTAFVQKATLRPSQSTPPTPLTPTQLTTGGMMATHLSGKCAGSRTMHLD